MTALASVTGMNRETGQIISGIDHIRQSIMDILTTPVGSRICNRDYGSQLPDLIDAPMNDAGGQSLYAATAMAIARFYPQITLTRMELNITDPGQYIMDIYGHETGSQNSQEVFEQAPFQLAIPLNPGASNFNREETIQ